LNSNQKLTQYLGMEKQSMNSPKLQTCFPSHLKKEICWGQWVSAFKELSIGKWSDGIIFFLKLLSLAFPFRYLTINCRNAVLSDGGKYLTLTSQVLLLPTQAAITPRLGKREGGKPEYLVPFQTFSQQNSIHPDINKEDRSRGDPLRRRYSYLFQSNSSSERRPVCRRLGFISS
jgi:hypothetical protein